MSYSHASVNPEDQKLLMDRFSALGKMKPNEVEKQSDILENSSTSLLVQSNTVLNQTKKKRERKTEEAKLLENGSHTRTDQFRPAK